MKQIETFYIKSWGLFNKKQWMDYPNTQYQDCTGVKKIFPNYFVSPDSTDIKK